VQLTVLGCYGPFPPAGGACSGYLLQEEGFKLLIDCGNGVLSRLQEVISYMDLHAVLLSHLHADHISDLMVMRYGLETAFNRGLRNEPLKVYAPPEPAVEFNRLTYKNAYSVKPLQSGQKLQIGPFSIQTAAGVHAIFSLAMRVKTASGDLVYSGDTEYFDRLELFAAETGLFLCEANFQEKDLENKLPNHMSASQAAVVAAKAGVKRLLLTHLHPESDPAVSLNEAEKYFPTAEIAREGESYKIGD